MANEYGDWTEDDRYGPYQVLPDDFTMLKDDPNVDYLFSEADASALADLTAESRNSPFMDNPSPARSTTVRNDPDVDWDDSDDDEWDEDEDEDDIDVYHINRTSKGWWESLTTAGRVVVVIGIVFLLAIGSSLVSRLTNWTEKKDDQFFLTANTYYQCGQSTLIPGLTVQGDILLNLGDIGMDKDHYIIGVFNENYRQLEGVKYTNGWGVYLDAVPMDEYLQEARRNGDISFNEFQDASMFVQSYKVQGATMWVRKGKPVGGNSYRVVEASGEKSCELVSK